MKLFFFGVKLIPWQMFCSLKMSVTKESNVKCPNGLALNYMEPYETTQYASFFILF